MLFKTGKIYINSLLNSVKELPTELRISEISRYFLSIPYKKNSLIGSLTEQEKLVVDLEGVDCMTFIEYVEALRLSNDLNSFIENLKKVRYFDGAVDFKKRRHYFTDWNELKTVKNVTAEITEEFVTVVKKLNFIEGLEPKQRIVNYIPATILEKIAFKLKTGDYCGFYTSRHSLDVTHTGIIILDEGIVKLRHASSHKGHVVDEDFLRYSKQKEGIIIFRPEE
ncbi:N-acetylmuramoyl-L-alanine amidase-like domain-containing protein [Thermodesulfovibrio sp. 3907-1M]|uniref:N-acetylmuramoyl-L-alanine amidase-like domain-containing protein n=1 Tax=Thermodesulfovibrio autotrophicus TaxID=3118333 RepID=A0AAU8GZC4_9BACT